MKKSLVKSCAGERVSGWCQLGMWGSGVLRELEVEKVSVVADR